MATSQRIRGNKGLILTMEADGGAVASVADDVKQFELTAEDADEGDLTFAEAAAGIAADWTLKLTGIQSNDAASLWEFLWSHAGGDVDVILGPHGNAVPTATKPHYGFLANVGKKPVISNEARTGKEGAEFEHELEVIGDITKIIA